MGILRGAGFADLTGESGSLALIKGVLVQEKGIQFINENECPSAAAVNLGALDMLACTAFSMSPRLLSESPRSFAGPEKFLRSGYQPRFLGRIKPA